MTRTLYDPLIINLMGRMPILLSAGGTAGPTHHDETQSFHFQNKKKKYALLYFPTDLR